MNPFTLKLIGHTINLLSYLSPVNAAKIAVKIFSTPRNANLDDEAKCFLDQAHQENLSYGGFSIITYHWANKGKTVLLAHGWDSNSFRWKDLINLLIQNNFNIISIDAPAHGASGNKIFNAPLYAECLNVAIKKYAPSVLIGHSVGGTASAIALTNYKDIHIDKLVLLGAPSNLAISVGNYVKMMKYNKRVSKAINRYYQKHFGRLPEFYCVENFFSSLEPKGLIIHDRRDNIISYKEALDIHRAYKNSKLIKTIGLGHRLKSDKVYRHILDFITT
ncbi:alpha/beta hydrolase [Cognatitamlana onchidii]|uniref:alpha/beta hydrolase n=1 Tax=Cognatitamlana onchidii TaxID=2562860 RepID=UPI0010A66D31|nr:alpha/beta hydrolase [Algibacter onchidii]